MRMLELLPLCLLLVLCFVTTGCKQPSNASGKKGNSKSSASSSTTSAAEQINAFATAYGNCIDGLGKGPSSWEDLFKFGDESVISGLREKGYVVAWGLRYRDATMGTGNVVVAMPSDAKGKGGTVVFLDGSSSNVSASQLGEYLEGQKDLGVPK